jgi:ADP-ribose pyrophosphatase YjhB (NUDIX family)
VWWFVRRPHTRGVKCIVRDGGQVLFVRHTYGRRADWELPGGSLARREAPEAAVRREVREELGVELRDLREVGRVEVSGQHKRTLLHCFEGAVTGGAPVRLAEAEIAEARWAPLDAPPQPLGEHAATLLALRRAELKAE